MPGIVVVGVSEQLSNFLAVHQFPKKVRPPFQIAFTINDNFVPCRRLLFDGFSVTKKTDIGEVRSHQVKLFFHLPSSKKFMRISVIWSIFELAWCDNTRLLNQLGEKT